MEQVEKALQRLREYGFRLSPKKCFFAQKRIDFLGHEISQDGYFPCESNLLPIKAFPKPKTPRQIKSFLGMCGYFRKYIPKFSQIAAPMIKLTHINEPFIWTDEQESAFEFLKKKLIEKPILVFPDYTKPFHIFVDASLNARGGALMQEYESTPNSRRMEMKPIAYWSRVNSATERKWSVIQLELSAIVLALRQFQPYIYAQKVIVHSDHKPLIYLMTRKATHPNLSR